MNTINRKFKNINTILIIYCLIFFLWWTLHEFNIKPLVSIALGDLYGVFINSIIKVSTWTMPCIFLLKKYSKDVVISIETMFINRFKSKLYIIALGIMILYLVFISYMEKGFIAVDKSFDLTTLIGPVLFVGITEEMVFRGWILNVLLKKMKLVYALIIDAVLFLIIHFPIWILESKFKEYMLFGNFISIMLLSIIFSMLFIKSKNILVPIIFHMTWNLFIIII